ncbi:ABC transporter ATP-binding protein [Frigidibacter sp. ROC022]|uniref:ABC transporter ATP-binding protein n=1 Tax=Frigidibacter sp. ROC022 TaxID=2971796 RepID=UPI00215A633B|nr:ABC transporter ATP-binding protein [Frigidibacter sp. ROC022]MCR8725819.1 ABC transporter ATP-binding protein [Frigidibacter sp. ROC022]
MAPIIRIQDLGKTYGSGTVALNGVTLDIEEGEILALLGPNGAGKTTLISTICGLIEPTRGSVTVGGFDIRSQYRQARSLIGLVPQEVLIEPFEKVGANVAYTRGLYGKPPDPAHIEKVLRSLALWDKVNARTLELSGGMKRRVLIAKALSHGPKILFLDEPSAGVDVNLRREMWALVRELREEGTTIVLTTHYIEEAEEMADRVGIVNKGRLLLVEDKVKLMQSFGRKVLTIELTEDMAELPEGLARDGLRLESGKLVYEYDTHAERSGVARLISDISAAGLAVRDLSTEQSTLEEVFLDLVEGDKAREATT